MARASVIPMMAVGIGGATAIFSVADAVVLRPLPYDAPKELLGDGLERVRLMPDTTSNASA